MKRFFSLFLSMALVTGSMTFAYGNDAITKENISQEPTKYEGIDKTSKYYNPQYEKFLKEIEDLPEDEQKAKMANAPSVYSYNEEYVPNNAENGIATIAASLPSQYNNTLTPNHLSTFQNEVNKKNGWAFAANAALEANIMKNNGDYVVDLSEQHLRYATSGDMSEEYGYPKGATEEGNFSIALGYWTRSTMGGPSLESDMPYKPDVGFIYSLDDIKNTPRSKYYVAETKTISSLADSSGSVPARVNSVKNMIYDNGAVYVSYQHSDSNFNSSKTAYNAEEGTEDNPVVLVGWDDTYSKSNFKLTPSIDGAFVAVDSNNPRCFYLSYDMVTRIGPCSSVSKVVNYDKYDHIYDYESRIDDGWYSNTAYNSDGKTNAFVHRYYVNSDNEEISAVSTYCPVPNARYRIYVSPNGNRSNLFPQELDVSNSDSDVLEVTVSNIGYHTFDLKTPVKITGDSFWVGVEVTSTLDTNWTIPCGWYGNDAANNNCFYAENMNDIISNTNVATSTRIVLRAHTKNIVPDEMSWNLAEKDYSELAKTDESVTVNGLTFNVKPNKTFAYSPQKDIGETKYDQIFSLAGKGCRDYRNISFNIPNGTVDIDILAKATSEGNERELVLATDDKILETFKVDKAQHFHCELFDENARLYLYSNANAINIFSLGYKVKDKSPTTDNDNKIWTFDNEDLSSYFNSTTAKITNDMTTSDGLTFRASEEYPISPENYNIRDAGNLYYRYVDLEGASHFGKRQILFDVKKDMDIYITAAHMGSSTETRYLNVVGQYGDTDIIESVDGVAGHMVPITHQLKTYKIKYVGDGDKIMIHSKDNGMRIYKIAIAYRNDASVNNNFAFNVDDNYDTAGYNYKTLDFNGGSVMATSNSGYNVVSSPIEYNGKEYNFGLRLATPYPSYRESRSIKFMASKGSRIHCLVAGTGKVYLADDYSIINEYDISDISNLNIPYEGNTRNLYLFTSNTATIYSVTSDTSDISPYSLETDIMEISNEITSEEISEETTEKATTESETVEKPIVEETNSTEADTEGTTMEDLNEAIEENSTIVTEEKQNIDESEIIISQNETDENLPSMPESNTENESIETAE